MGGGTSKGSPESSSLWNTKEQIENEFSIEVQKRAADFIIQHLYYGVPIKAKKESLDPKSCLVIEPVQEVFEDVFESHNGDSTDVNSFNLFREKS